MNRDDDVDDGDRHVGDMQGALMSEVACSSAKKNWRCYSHEEDM